MDINKDSIARKILLEEFIKGSKSEQERTTEEKTRLDGIEKKLKDIYQWNVDESVAELATQNCSDMLVDIGKDLGRE